MMEQTPVQANTAVIDAFVRESRLKTNFSHLEWAEAKSAVAHADMLRFERMSHAFAPGDKKPAAPSGNAFLDARSQVLCTVHPRAANATDGNDLHSHDFFELVYVYRGICKQYFHAGEETMGRGSFCLLNTHAEHGIAVESDDDVVINVLISQTFFTNTLKRMVPYDGELSRFFWGSFFEHAGHEHISFAPNHESHAEQFVQLLIVEFVEQQPGCNQAMTAYLALLFCELMRGHAYQMASKDERASICYEALSYIDEHLAEVTLNELADHMGYSAGYLSRTLKDYTGNTFSQLHLDMRLRRSAEYLEHSSLSIEDIAERFGFYDRSHFNKAFKSHYGMSPSTWRKEHQDR